MKKRSCKGPICTCGSMRCKNMIGIPILVGPIEPELNLSDYQDTYNNYTFSQRQPKFVPSQTLGYPDGTIEKETTSKATYVPHKRKKPEPYAYIEPHYRQCKHSTSSHPEIYNPLEQYSQPPWKKQKIPLSCYRDTHRAFNPFEVESKQAEKVPPIDNITVLPGKIAKRSVAKRDFHWHKRVKIEEANGKNRPCVKLPRRVFKALDQQPATYYWPRTMYRNRAKKTRATRGHGDDAAEHARVQTDITRVLGEGLGPRSPQIDFELEPLETPEPMPVLVKNEPACKPQRARATSFKMDLEQRCKNNNCRCDICTAQSRPCEESQVPPTPPCSQRSAIVEPRWNMKNTRPDIDNEKKEVTSPVPKIQQPVASPYDVVKAMKSPMSIRAQVVTPFDKPPTPKRNPIGIATPCLRRQGGPATPETLASPPASVRREPLSTFSRASRRTQGNLTPEESDDVSIHMDDSNNSSEQSSSLTAEITSSLERMNLRRPSAPTPAFGRRIPVVRPPFAVDTWVA